MTQPQPDPRSVAMVFDLGGVLIDWNPRYLYNRFFPGDPQAVERFLAEIDFFTWNVKQDAGRSFAKAIREQCELFPDRADLIRAYDSDYAETVAGPIQPVVEILAELRRAGYPLYALSNWPLEKFVLVRPRFAFFDWFEYILVSGEVGVVKPDPRIYTLLLDHIQRPAQECIFIDDSAENVAAAQKLGFCAVLYRSPEQLKAELSLLGVAEDGKKA